jgi:general secretion pathway protein L
MAHKILGIELGAYSLKVVVAQAGFRSVTIADYIEEPLPPGDDPADERAALVLGQILRSRGLDLDIPHLALPGDAVSMRVLEFGFTGLKRADLDKTIGSELEAQLPHDLDELVYDFETIPMTVDPRPVVADNDPTFVGGQPGAPAPAAGTRALAAATTKERVARFLRLASQQGIEPRSVVAGPTAYAKAVEKLAASGGPEAKDDTIVVIDVGHLRTNVCVVKNGKALFARTLSRGGKQITQAIAKTWNLSAADAEQAKHRDGYVGGREPGAGADYGGRGAGQAALTLPDVILREVQPLARDLRQTLSACRAQTGAAPRRAILCGGGGRLRGLGPYLAGELELPVGIVTPDDSARLIGVPATQRGMLGDAAVLTHGLVLEAATGRPQFDLRKGELAYRADLSFLRAKAGFLAACALVIVAFASINAYASLYMLKKERAQLDERLHATTTEIFGEPLTVEDLDAKLGPSKEKSPLPKLSAFDQLVEISKKLPKRDQVKLDVLELDIRPQKVAIKAKTDSMKSIDDIEKALKGIECFTEVQRGKVEGPEGEKKFSFSITTKCM